MISRITNLDFRFSLARNLLILFIFWIIFYPGFFSGDSFGAVDMAKTGNLTNSFTASWAIYVRLFSLFGNAIGPLTLIGGLLLVFATTQLTYTLFDKKTAAITSSLMCLTPVVWGMGITLWHDIQMTSGMLLVTTFMVKIHRQQKVTHSEILSQLIFGSVLLSFRPNGLPTLLLFSFIFFALIRRKIVLKFLLLAFSSTLLITITTSTLILGLSPINNYFAQEWMRNDISCFADSSKGEGFVEKNIPTIGNTESWRSAAACTFLNQAKVSYEDKVRAQKFVPGAWISLFKHDPGFVINTHLQRNAYLIPFPLNGLPNPPFLHSTIEYEYQGIKWAFPSIAGEVRVTVRLWNAIRGITSWVGLWAALIFVSLTIWGRNQLFAPFLMSISLIAILFIFSPIPDGRYGLFVLIVGQISLLGVFIEWLRGKTKQYNRLNVKPINPQR